MNRPTTGAEPGWPRPHLPCDADLEAQHRLDAQPHFTPSCPIKGTRPVPWLAEQDDTSWDPWAFDEARAAELRERDLCQVCGEERGEAVYVLVRAVDRERHRWLESIGMFGGALCSLRCARLTAAVCPRYARDGPVDIYTVPNDERVDSVGCGEKNDDEVDVTAPGCRRISTVRGAS